VQLKPIGVIHTPFQQASGTPIQTRAAEGVEGTVEIFPEFVAGLRDLDGFDRIWLLYWFDRTAFDQTGLIVSPYLDPHGSHGVFATRAPARPNPIGMSPVRLLEVRGNVLRVRDLDMLDGTPLLDIKPYVPQFDCFEVTRSGWVDSVSDWRPVADSRFERKK
jgi:tRNA-Thr(GGU) m(6)t(6)A37 methyltransferase TsaA